MSGAEGTGKFVGERLAPGRGRVLLAEFVHSAGRVDDLLLARVERMAVRTHFDLQVVSQSRLRLERVAAGAAHVDFLVLGVRIGFHGFLSTGRILPAGV